MSELTDSQFSPEKIDEVAMLFSWFWSSETSDWILLRSTPFWLAAVSFVLMSSRTSRVLLRPW